MKDLIFFGIQGSGKGTQGAIFAKKHGLKVFETGAELRRIATEDSDLGKRVKSIIEAGNLVTNEIVMQVLEDFLFKTPSDQNVLFDGIPRSVEQKETFDVALRKFDRNPIGVVIDISEDESKRRLLGRRLCSDCKKVFASDYSESKCDSCGGELVKRSDDNEQAILKRIENFKVETMPAIEIYEKEGRVLKVSGQQSIEAVANEIEKVLTEV